MCGAPASESSFLSEGTAALTRCGSCCAHSRVTRKGAWPACAVRSAAVRQTEGTPAPADNSRMAQTTPATAEQIAAWNADLPSALEKTRDGLPLDAYTPGEIAAMAYWHVLNNDL